MTTPATLLAQGIADAMGCPFEVPNEAPLFHPKLAGWTGNFLSTRGGWHDLDPGQWSDDTQFAEALARALLADGNFSVKTVAEMYVALFKRGIRGIGGTCKKALVALSEGASPVSSGIEGAEGNGTAMRAAPIGLFFRGAPVPYVMDVARMDARITHRSVEAQEGSAAVAAMVACLANGMGRWQALKAVRTHLAPGSRVRNRLTLLDMIADAPGAVIAPEMALSILLTEFGTRGHVVQTVPSAVACFLLTSTYEQAILAAIRGGGDSDTTAAITGALAGTKYGIEGISERLRTGVDQPDMLHGLDRRLVEVGDAFTKGL